LFSFPRPEALAQLIRDADADPAHPTWRAKVRTLPPLDTTGLRPAQIEAVRGVERSLVEQRFDRSLIQMATGAGKTYTAVTQAYRLLEYGGFRRILFLVDRINLAKQTLAEFQNYRTPGDGRRPPTDPGDGRRHQPHHRGQRGRPGLRHGRGSYSWHTSTRRTGRRP